MDVQSLYPQKSIRSARLGLSDRCVILLMFLLPLPSFLGDAAARAADAIRFGAVSGHLLLSRQSSWSGHIWRVSAILLSMFLFACVSLIYGVSHSLRDLLDVLRIAAFWTVFLFGASLAWRGRSDPCGTAISCSRMLMMVGVLNALFTVNQYLFPSVTRPIQELFAMGDRHMELLSDQGRAFGFFVNPNTNAVMLLLLSLPGLALFQLTNRKRYLLYGSFVFATVLLTGSRTGLILAAVMVAVLCIASRRLTYLAALAAAAWASYEALGCLIDTGAAREWFPYLSELLIKIHGSLHGDHVDLESINSFKARLAIWDETLRWFYDNPALGAGPLREVIPSFADNYYIYLLSRYGMVGLVLYVSYTAYIIGLSILAILHQRRPQKEWGTLALASIVTVNGANYAIDASLIVPIASLSLLYAGYLACLLDTSRPSLNKSLVWRRG